MAWYWHMFCSCCKPSGMPCIVNNIYSKLELTTGKVCWEHGVTPCGWMTWGKPSTEYPCVPLYRDRIEISVSIIQSRAKRLCLWGEFEIDQLLEVLWCSLEHNFQCFSKHLAAAVEMSSIQYRWSFLTTVSPQHVCFSECATHWEFNSGRLGVWAWMSLQVQRTVSLHTLSLLSHTRAQIFTFFSPTKLL